ncbi:MAG TPA: YgjV family protein [Terracidiphilus sp.]|nr:YgjV family protein [Terracidiphilus sp.]
MTLLNSIGWVATAVFASSYFFRQPAMLRKIQAGAALLWVVYGFLIGAMPVVVANLIVAGAAAYSSFVAQRKERGEQMT